MFWEFTVYITQGETTWEGFGYWPVIPDSQALFAAQLEMAKSLEIGLNAHGFTQLETLETYLQAIAPGEIGARKVRDHIDYRVNQAGGILLRWSKVEPMKEVTNGEG